MTTLRMFDMVMDIYDKVNMCGLSATSNRTARCRKKKNHTLHL